MSFRFPYLSLDIETTGLDLDKAHVLQLAAVYDNGRDLEELPTFNQIVRWPEIHYANEWALNTNRWLLERAFKQEDVYSIKEVRANFDAFLYKAQPEGRITAAGKNAGGFDLPILRNSVNGFTLRRILHRVLDPGSMYTMQFTHIPNMDEINKFLARPKVSHDALDDCWDVIHAVRYQWETPSESL